MTGRILDIDHLMVSVADTEKTAETMTRLGFTVTPRSGLPGMSNRLVCFEPPSPDRCNFVEFLSLEDPSAAPQIMSDILLPPERPASMVMVAGDVTACAADLREKGLEVADPWPLKRDWVLPGGEVISPQFVVVIPTVGQAPVYWNVVEYVTPEHYRRPEFVGHPNGASRLAGVIAVAADPAAVADHYARYWGAGVETEDDGGVRVSLDHVALTILSPEAAGGRYPGVDAAPGASAARLIGYVVEVADVAKLDSLLDGNGIAHTADGSGGSWVAPQVAHGCVLHFVAGGRGN